VLSTLVVLLTGTLLLGTSAFGMDEKRYLDHYENYGWFPEGCGGVFLCVLVLPKSFYDASNIFFVHTPGSVVHRRTMGC
jgi:hypothetical protein